MGTHGLKVAGQKLGKLCESGSFGLCECGDRGSVGDGELEERVEGEFYVFARLVSCLARDVEARDRIALASDSSSAALAKFLLGRSLRARRRLQKQLPALQERGAP